MHIAIDHAITVSEQWILLCNTAPEIIILWDSNTVHYTLQEISVTPCKAHIRTSAKLSGNHPTRVPVVPYHHLVSSAHVIHTGASLSSSSLRRHAVSSLPNRGKDCMQPYVSSRQWDETSAASCGWDCCTCLCVRLQCATWTRNCTYPLHACTVHQGLGSSGVCYICEFGTLH